MKIEGMDLLRLRNIVVSAGDKKIAYFDLANAVDQCFRSLPYYNLIQNNYGE